MSDDERKVGDVVVLKSGGPAMTVMVISGNDAVCAWTEKGRSKKQSFPSDTLKRYEPPRLVRRKAVFSSGY